MGNSKNTDPLDDERYQLDTAMELSNINNEEEDDDDNDNANTNDNDENHKEKRERERKLVRKITWAFIPWLCLVELVQLTDKQILSSAAVMGIYEDTKIDQWQFSMLGSILYVGILVFQAPNAYLIQKLPIAKYFGAAIFSWGCVVAFTALCTDFGGLATVRFLLGLLESTVYPCIFLLISTFYRRSEQVIWYGAVIISSEVLSIVSGLAIYAIGHMDKLGGISSWKWAQIIWGAITLFVGGGVFFFLPDKPKSRWFRLTPTETVIVDERTRDNAVVRNKQFKVAHVIEAVKEPRLYCYCLTVIMISMQSGAIGLYGALLVKNMGFTNLDALALGIPQRFVSITLLCTAMYFSHKFKEIGYVGASAFVLSFIGVLLLRVLPDGAIKLVGYYFSPVNAGYVMIVTSASNNVAGYTKKIFYNGCILTALCVGNMIGPLLMTESDSPRYTRAFSIYMVADLIAIALSLILRCMHVRDNHQKKESLEQGKVHTLVGDRNKLFTIDLTDIEDPYYVYRI
ncbi:major facilitator superfamily domain-containing protein [Phascolomyces articulosus]|uniref:Major facilitator superfamily domain-containing protein n=1 Tax=Phascolomyces articulosus TaxID=60185 RepID=A0AAD5PBS6_9FUNG|nr:major facilitator superfamily domain-containing protein [Phascolomyces articulosus]